MNDTIVTAWSNTIPSFVVLPSLQNGTRRSNCSILSLTLRCTFLNFVVSSARRSAAVMCFIEEIGLMN